ncbi:uncharacterized protein LOC125669637 isoform X4 [Ostrea edulis]|uniref:uncharacterized protein LOC125669637 isoform X4 n=1 Tax=Ostrea edulis TaxID=37623 RepID=UPI0020946BC6|nr:uncharacterized protein LOC125669637 isoform X4 [Ostrea edulis]
MMKTPKFQRLNGWDLPFENESLDIVAWASLQTALHSKKERKKSKLPTEDLVFRHVPNYRCPTLEDPTEFERSSIHKRICAREKPASEQPTVRPIRRSKTTLTLTSVRSNTEKSLQKVGEDSEEGYKKSKSKDDMDALTRAVSKEMDKRDEGVPKRSRSVPVPYMPERPENAPSFRRLLYYARKYGSKDDAILDEEDEGYGSKTPSAEDKDVTSLYDDFTGRGFQESSYDHNGNTDRVKKLAKFSYTHQLPKTTSLYEESEDEKVIRSGERNMKYYKTGYVEEKDNSFVRKMLHRSHSSIGQYETSSFHGTEDIKPAIVLRKITIQNAQEENKPSREQSAKQAEKKTFYEPHKTIVRQNSFVQNDRAQYPVYCTSPEFKFAHLPQRPSSKKQQREINPSASARKNMIESARRLRTPNLELYRAHTSVCMPIGDLLPAVDRSLRKGNSSKSKQQAHVSQSMPDSLNTILSARKSYEEVQQAGLEYIMNNQNKGIITPPFRNSHSTSVDSTTKSASDKNATVQYSTPSRISLDDFASVSSLSTSREENKTKVTTTEAKSSKQREGIPSLALSMSGIDIEIKHGIVDKNIKTVGKVRFTAHPDKDTKKKLRDAFSRFYNKQPYGASTPTKNWTEELKFMWNT